MNAAERLEESIYVGLDPGSRILGWAAVRAAGTRLAHVDFGSVRADRSDDFCDRLRFVADEVEAILVRLKPKAVAIERAFVAKNPATALRIAELRGALFLVVHRSGARLVEVAPKTAKKTLVGRGAAKKSQVAFMVEKLFGVAIDNIDADATDAMAIAVRLALDSSLRDIVGEQVTTPLEERLDRLRRENPRQLPKGLRRAANKT